MSSPFGDVQGRPSRAAVTAALEAHVACLKGKPLRAAIGNALDAGGNLGGKERRFVAWAARELSRHLRRLDLSARARGYGGSRLHLTEDQAIFRFALWRLELTGAPAERVLEELKLPGPLRPRSLPDAVLAEALARQVTLDFGATDVDRAANRHSFPTWLARSIEASAPAGTLETVLEALNRDPRVMLRVRPPGSRDEVLALCQAQGVALEPLGEGDAVVVSDERRAVFESALMKNGRLQVMDVGSQRLAELCRATAGMTVVDYCAGAGGKTLALADAVGPTGRVYAYDKSPRRLKEAMARAAEFKLRHVSFPEKPRLDLAQVVLVDAPCSGVGTLARDPDQKWKLKEKDIAEFAKAQSGILKDIAPQLKSGAVIVYATCSLLREENEAVVEGFLKSHPGFEADGPASRVWPQDGVGGGFFGARLKKR